MKLSLQNLIPVLLLLLSLAASAQVNSGSNGSDGALNPTANLVIDMADHPDGIYHYTSVNIPAGVTVSFIPNAGNKPVVWLVQGNCTVAGAILLDGTGGSGSAGGLGWRSASITPEPRRRARPPFRSTCRAAAALSTRGL